MPGTRSVSSTSIVLPGLEAERLEAEVARRRRAGRRRRAARRRRAPRPTRAVTVTPPLRETSTAGEPTRTSTPRSTSDSCTSFAANSSSRPSSRGAASTIVTFEPSVNHAWPSSTPTTPPPSTISRSGTSSEVVASRFVHACASARPGIGGTAASLPVAITTARRASSCRPSTSTRRSPAIRACAAHDRDAARLEPRQHPRVVAVVDHLVAPREHGAPRRARRSPPRRAPGIRRASAIASAGRSSAFDGMQP